MDLMLSVQQPPREKETLICRARIRAGRWAPWRVSSGEPLGPKRSLRRRRRGPDLGGNRPQCYSDGVYHPHPSQRLTDLFRAKPYQGARPQDAEFVFVGLADIERSQALFDSVIEYHADGVAFWQRYEKHHPFLLGGYSGDGWRYHQNFAKAEFRPEDAGRVSFVELLHIPTIRGSDLELKDLDPRHLDELNELILCGTRRNVFLSDKVVKLMRRYAPFRRWLRTPIANQVLPVLHKEGATTVYQHLHFSNYGIFHKRMTLEAAAIAAVSEGQKRIGNSLSALASAASGGTRRDLPCWQLTDPVPMHSVSWPLPGRKQPSQVWAVSAVA